MKCSIMKKVALITGITGFAGSHLAELLLKEGYEVHGIVRWRSRSENVSHLNGSLHLVEADLQDLRSLQDTMMSIRPEFVFHLAAQSYVPASWTSPSATFETNVIGSCNLFESIRKISHLAHFSYVRQNEPKGDGDAILKAAALINNEPVAVLFGDDIIDSKIPTLKKMIDIYCQYQEPVIALERVAKKDVPHYGIVKASKVKERIYRIEKIMEKPALKEAPSNLAVVGKYIINPGIFEELRRLQKSSLQEWGLAHALDGYSKKKPVYGYEIEGTRYDCGTKIGFLKAVVDYGLKHKETKKEFKKYLKGLKI